MRTEARSPGTIGNAMYAATAKTLPTIEAKNIHATRRSFWRSLTGSRSETRGR